MDGYSKPSNLIAGNLGTNAGPHSSLSSDLLGLLTEQTQVEAGRQRYPLCETCGYCSVTKLCLALWPMDCSTPASSVLHYLPEFAQIHVYSVSDDI